MTPLVSRRLEYAGDTLAQPFVSTTGRTLYLVQPTNPESAIAILDPDQLRVVEGIRRAPGGDLQRIR